MAFVTTLLAIVALALGLVFVATLRARARQRSAYKDAAGHWLTPAAGTDEDARQALERAGADLTQAHVVRCFLRVPTRGGADRVTMLLRSHGFADVYAVPRSGEWFVYATTALVPELDTMTTLRADLDGLAHSVGGAFDGWSAAAAE